MAKEYLKMADQFSLPVNKETLEIYCREHYGETFSSGEEYAAHAINSHDELVKSNAELNEKIDNAWNRKHRIDGSAFIPGGIDAWKQPVKQFLPYDFSGNPGANATQYCNGWNDAGGYWKNHVDDITKQRDELVAEVERLRESNKRMADAIWSRSSAFDCLIGRQEMTRELFIEHFLCDPLKQSDSE